MSPRCRAARARTAQTRGVTKLSSIPARRTTVRACPARTSAWVQSSAGHRHQRPLAERGGDSLGPLGFLPAADRILKEGIAVIEVTRNHTGDSLQDCSYRRRRDARCHALAHGLVGVGPHLLRPRAGTAGPGARRPTPRRKRHRAGPRPRAGGDRPHRPTAPPRPPGPPARTQRPASAASTRCCSIAPRSSSHRSHRWTVATRPCRRVRTMRRAARPATASTSSAAMEYSSASSGRPFRTHHPAARRRRTGISSGSWRRSSASSMSRNR